MSTAADRFLGAATNGDPYALKIIELRLAAMRHIETITTRELTALQLMSHGHDYQETGREMGVNKETVKTTLARARRKLGAKNTTHAVAIALREGMIQ